jgi:hypothetical protein
MLSSEVTPGQTLAASDYNNLRQDVINKVLVPKVLQTTRAMNEADGDIVIAHGMGVKPAYIQVIARCPYRAWNSSDGARHSTSDGFSDGTVNACVAAYGQYDSTFTTQALASNFNDRCLYIQVQNSDSGGNIRATATMDDTNITLSFVKSGSQTHTVHITIIAFYV